MNKHLFPAAFLIGALAVVWVGAGFIGTNHLALAMTAAIAAVYGYGAYELLQFRRATVSLTTALAAIPAPLAQLDDWLGRVHASLRNPVRLRIEGERVGLPGPALTPYLVGLLVMLGMLGTFLGMVVTFQGAVFALEGTTDLQAIRSALAAPIRGLGLAFGTSVAGVAASAMLGLMSALSRRARMQAAQVLDSRIATVLRPFSLTQQRQETFKALQFQAQALPQVVDQMQAMMAQMERMSQQLNARLLANQEGFHGEIKAVYGELARAVDQSLRESLTEGAQAAGASLLPVVEMAMTGIARDAQTLHERVTATTQRQLDGLAASLAANAQAAASHTLGEIARLAASSEDLARARIAAEADWVKQHGERMDQLAGVLRAELGLLRDDEARRGDAAVARLGELQTALAGHLTTLGTALEDPIARLMETAAQAPRAAAEVIGQLRQEISRSVARDNDLLEERGRILETLNTLLASITHAAAEQRTVIDALVASSAVALDQAGSRFGERMDAETTKLAEIAAQVTGSAVEVSSLGEAFGYAVNSFTEANAKLVANLQRIEAALDKSMLRSDEQLAYYVAQAREVIDLSIASQQEIFARLRQLPGQPAQLAAEVA